MSLVSLYHNVWRTNTIQNITASCWYVFWHGFIWSFWIFSCCMFCPRRTLTYKKSLTLRCECGTVPTSWCSPAVRENRSWTPPRTCWPATPGSRHISHSCRGRKGSRTWWEQSGGKELGFYCVLRCGTYLVLVFKLHSSKPWRSVSAQSIKIYSRR